jgi:hypothetical protein
MIDNGSTLPHWLQTADSLLQRQNPHELKNDTKKWATIQRVQRDLLCLIEREMYAIMEGWSPEQRKHYASTDKEVRRKPLVSPTQEYSVQREEKKDGKLMVVMITILGFRSALREYLDLLNNESIRIFPSMDALLRKEFSLPPGYFEAFDLPGTGRTDAKEIQTE